MNPSSPTHACKHRHLVNPLPLVFLCSLWITQQNIGYLQMMQSSYVIFSPGFYLIHLVNRMFCKSQVLGIQKQALFQQNFNNKLYYYVSSIWKINHFKYVQISLEIMRQIYFVILEATLVPLCIKHRSFSIFHKF